MKPCNGCKGSGITVHAAFTSLEGKKYPERRYQCSSCGGAGQYPEADETAIRSLITATKGKNKGRLRASMASPFKTAGMVAERAYYVWRLARFHGGADVTMPFMAGLLSRNDPYHAELDALADKVAKESFGTDLAAAYRWGRALGAI